MPSRISSPSSRLFHLAACLLLFSFLAGCASPTPVPTNSPEPLITLDLLPTQTLTPTITDTPTITPTRTVTPTPTNTPRPTYTLTLAPTGTPTNTPVGTLTPTPRQMPRGPFKAVLRLEEITPGQITALYVPPVEDQILIAGTFGMARIDLDSRMTHVARFWGQSLGIDSSGQAWALPPDGAVIAAWEDNSWREFDHFDGWVLPAKLPQTIVTNSQVVAGMGATVWLATASDVRRFDGSRWTIYPATSTGILLPYKAGVESALVVAAYRKTGEAWAGSCDWQDDQITGGGGLRFFDGRRWLDSRFPLRSACILFLQVAPSGDVWAAAGSDLWKLPAGADSWQQFSPPSLPEDRRYSHVLDLVLDPLGEPCPLMRIEDIDGRPQEEIRFCLEGSSWQPVRTLPALAHQELRFAPDGSRLSFEEGAVHRLNEAGVWEPLAEMKYAAFAVGSDAKIWLVSMAATRPVIWQADISPSR